MQQYLFVLLHNYIYYVYDLQNNKKYMVLE
jgi:hypothetical protein